MTSADEQEHAEDDLEPADRDEPRMRSAMDDAHVPSGGRASNTGGDMSETSRSRDQDLDDDEAESSVRE